MASRGPSGIQGSKAGLIDLRTGKGRKVDLGGWAMDPHRGADGNLLFGLDGKEYSLEPATGAVAARP